MYDHSGYVTKYVLLLNHLCDYNDVLYKPATYSQMCLLTCLDDDCFCTYVMYICHVHKSMYIYTLIIYTYTYKCNVKYQMPKTLFATHLPSVYAGCK